MMRARLAFLSLSLLALAPTSASAHGRDPTLVNVAFHPGDPDHVVVGATWGFITTRDGGATWTWQCADVVPFDRTREDPQLAIFPSGATIASTFDGLRRSEPSQCAWSRPETAPEEVFVTDAVRDPTAPRTGWIIVSPGGSPDTIHRTEDEGLTWSQVAMPHPRALTDRLRIAPSDGSRIYTSGVIPVSSDTPRQGIVLRSDDRGETWRELPVALVEGERTVLVLGVDPTDPDRVFARATRLNTDETPERLLLSEDGGETWRAVLEITEIIGFAMSEDGASVWAGSWDGGLHRSTDRGLTFAPLDEALRVRCLAHRPGELWVCAEDRSAGFALARSIDEGETLEPLWGYDDVTPDVGCAADTPVGMRCPMFWPDLTFDLQIDAGVPFDAGGIGMDGGAAPRPYGGGSCGCRAAGAGGGAAPWAASLLLLAIAWRARRRA